MKSNYSFFCDRAWIEINSNNLLFNINQIKKIISSKCKIMAVVKANAYGHGIVEISKLLNKFGIYDFAVATIDEAICLRKNNIKGNILILGYTSLCKLKYVLKYDLIQTIVDLKYSKQIEKLKLNRKIKCHIKVNTGMNRLGESYSDIFNIIKIFNNKNLDILGIYSHLCVADSDKLEDINYTKKQIEDFNKCIFKLKSLGFNNFKTHIQSSYGIINYSQYNFNYVRLGIAMYGVNDNKSILLKPVLKLKSRITSIKSINKNDTVGYGRMYKSDKMRRIATVSIGYADGYPRALSFKNTVVKVNDRYVPIIGKICMDQLMIDVTNIRNVRVNDIVTLIDDDLISIENISNLSDTITYELLSRLGSRLNRVVY